MEVRLLTYFLAVANEGTVTRAAESLHITQPTLSRQLAQLERELGVQLFERGSRHVALTEEGRLLRARAREIIELVEKTENEVARRSQELEGVVVVGTGETVTFNKVADLFEGFRRVHPGVTFDLYTATADLIKERMDAGLVDVGLLLEPVGKERYGYVRCGVEERWVVAMRPDDPLAALDSVGADDLVGLPLVLPRRADVRSELASWFGDSYDRMSVAFTNNLSANSLVLAQRGLGYPLVIEGLLPLWDASLIVYRPLRPALRTTSVLAWKRDGNPSRAAAAFIAYAQEHL